MNINLKQFTGGLIVLSSLFLASCGSEGEQKHNDSLEPATEAASEVKKEVQTFYQIPSPAEMFEFINNGKLKYKAELLNSPDNLMSYADKKAQSINFGVYSADLAYTSSFEKYQESIKFFGTIRKLSNDLGISYAFDEALVNRIQNNMSNADSLVIISSDSYLKIIEFLEGNEQGKTLALIAAGGWLESLYLVLNLVDLNSADDKMKQKISDQRYTFENLNLYLNKYSSDPNVGATLKDFEEIKAVFDSMAQNGGSSMKKTGGKRVLGGSNSGINTEQLNSLKEKVNTLRAKFVSNKQN